jgi:hypothetical protein
MEAEASKEEDEQKLIQRNLTLFLLGVLKKNNTGKKNRCGGLYKIGFVQGPYKLNNGPGKLID